MGWQPAIIDGINHCQAASLTYLAVNLFHGS
jgi:hypothetical protein